jgi:pimeloyl-ACP methyl ester carboxylesterase
MANYVLIHGAGDVGWYWHLVDAELRKAGHNVVAPDMPVDDVSAGLNEYADAVIEAIEDRDDLIVVAQSFGGFVAPIVATRTNAKLIVLVAAMIPKPGESGAGMFESANFQHEPQEDTSDIAVFCHDVPHDLAVEALAKGRDQAEKGFADPWPLEAWPNIPTKAIVGTLDRVFPVEGLSDFTKSRIGVTPDRIETGHCVALAKPVELAQYLESCRKELGIA